MNPFLLLERKDYLPILKTAAGTPVTRGTWRERRAEMKSLLETYSYGKTPDIPVRTAGKILSEEAVPGCGAVRQRIRITFGTGNGTCAFPMEIFVPDGTEKPPVLLHLAFRPVPDRYIPLEKILSAGYALAVVVYTDLVNDAHFGDFSDGIAAHFGTRNPRAGDEWGKIGMWAYGASRVLDYLLTDRPDLDARHTAVIGHSRLGKTALWCAALDERFAAAVSNDSGYGGAASSKRGTGERVTDFLRCGSWDWFCENFKDWSGKKEDCKPYDQSFMLAMIAPRFLCVGSAEDDAGADPVSEFLTTLHASAAWDLLGCPGLILPEDRIPRATDAWLDGNVGYHLRAGEHSLTPEDWDVYLRFLNQKFGRGDRSGK